MGRKPAILRMTPGQNTPEEVVLEALTPAATSDGRTIVFVSSATLDLWTADANGRRKTRLVLQLHRQEDRGARIFDGVDGDDVRVIERNHGERFAREAFAAVGVDGGDIGEQFECDLALQSRIACPIDLAHPAGAEQGHDFIGPESSARAQGHGASLWQHAHLA